MLMRYIGPLEEAQISVAGNDFGIVKQGEALVIPDYLAAQVAWSEHWEDAKATKTAPNEAKNTATAVNPVENVAKGNEDGAGN